MPTINLGRVRGNDGDTNVDTVVEYAEPSSYVELASGDTIRNLFSKISKGFKILFNSRKDTLYSQNGSGSITYNQADNSLVKINFTSTPTLPLKVKSTNKNILPKFSERTEYGVTLTVAEDGTMSLNGTATADLSFYSDDYYSSSQLIMYLKTGTYAMSLSNSSEVPNMSFSMAQPNLFVSATSKNAKSVKTITGMWVAYNKCYINIAAGTTLNNVTMKPQLEVGDTVTEYEMHTEEVIEVTASNVNDTFYLKSWEGITNVFVNTQNTYFTAEFKSKMWSKIDKANISHNLLTTNPDMVLGADMGKALNDRLDSMAGIGETGMTGAASGSMSASTWTTIQSVTLPKGVYKLVGKMQVPPSGSNSNFWAFAIRFTFETEYVSQVYHSSVGMAVEKTSYVAIGDTPTTINLAGYTSVLSNYGSARIRWERISNG